MKRFLLLIAAVLCFWAALTLASPPAPRPAILTVSQIVLCGRPVGIIVTFADGRLVYVSVRDAGYESVLAEAVALAPGKTARLTLVPAGGCAIGT